MSSPAVQQPESVQVGDSAIPPSVPVPAPYNPPAPQTSVSAAPSASLYVGELDPTVTEAMLFEIFNMIGPVARYVCSAVHFSLRCLSDPTLFQYQSLPRCSHSPFSWLRLC